MGETISVQWVYNDEDELDPATALNVELYGDKVEGAVPILEGRDVRLHSRALHVVLAPRRACLMMHTGPLGRLDRCAPPLLPTQRKSLPGLDNSDHPALYTDTKRHIVLIVLLVQVRK